MPDAFVLPAGQQLSNPVTLARGDRGVVLVFPGSCAVSDYRLQCATTSGAGAAGDAFGDWLVQPLGAAGGLSPFTVFSGGALGQPAVVSLPPPPTPYLRLRSVAAQTLTVSVAVFPYVAP
jgi:hypothetical protein